MVSVLMSELLIQLSENGYQGLWLEDVRIDRGSLYEEMAKTVRAHARLHLLLVEHRASEAEFCWRSYMDRSLRNLASPSRENAQPRNPTIFAQHVKGAPFTPERDQRLSRSDRLADIHALDLRTELLGDGLPGNAHGDFPTESLAVPRARALLASCA
jgi:hypothetical protein